MAQEARQETTIILKNTSKPKDNLTSTERRSIEALEKNGALMVLVTCEMAALSTDHPTNLFTDHRSSIIYKDCICWELQSYFSLAVELTVFQRKGSKCRPPACRQASHLLKIFLHTRRSSSLETLAISL